MSIDEIKEYFSCFEKIKTDKSLTQETTSSSKNSDPPNYVLKFLFLEILKFENEVKDCPIAQVEWTTTFYYKDKGFVIYDAKWDTWTLSGNRDLFVEVINILKEGCFLVDKYLSSILLPKIDSRDCLLNNDSYKLFACYKYYRRKIRSKIKILRQPVQPEITRQAGEKIDPSSITSSIASFLDENTKNWNKQVDRERAIVILSFGLVSSFFSLTEFLIEIFHVFLKPEENPFIFLTLSKKHRILGWFQKFKMTFDLKNPDFNQFFNSLGKIKNEIRNPLEHGLNDEVNLLFHLEGPIDSQLVPLHYRYLEKDLYYSWRQLSSEEIERIIDVFDSFLDFLTTEKPYCYYMLLIKSSLPIPLSKAGILRWKGLMTSKKRLEQEIINIQKYQDIRDNRPFLW